MKTFNHHTSTRERSTSPRTSTTLYGRAKRRAEQRRKAKALQKARLAAKRDENPRVIPFHFSH